MSPLKRLVIGDATTAVAITAMVATLIMVAMAKGPITSPMAIMVMATGPTVIMVTGVAGATKTGHSQEHSIPIAG